jgi:predicted transcriptional regulator of viral defense system
VKYGRFTPCPLNRKTMIGFLIKLAIFVVAGVLAYNYFFGTAEEKAHSTKVFGQVKEVAVSVGELAKSEKDKYDAGKYDAALDKLAGAYQTAREGAQKVDTSLLKRIAELEKRKEALKKELASIERQEQQTSSDDKSAARQAERKSRLERDLDRLIADSDNVLKPAQGGH